MPSEDFASRCGSLAAPGKTYSRNPRYVKLSSSSQRRKIDPLGDLCRSSGAGAATNSPAPNSLVIACKARRIAGQSITALRRRRAQFEPGGECLALLRSGSRAMAICIQTRPARLRRIEPDDTPLAVARHVEDRVDHERTSRPLSLIAAVTESTRNGNVVVDDLDDRVRRRPAIHCALGL